MAAAVVQGYASDDDIRAVATTFGGVEHRIEFVREKDGVKYYNDSIASSPTRTIAGLNSFQQKVILIAGGYDKHIPYDVLGKPICDHVKLLLLTGATAPKIRECVENIEGEHPPIIEVEKPRNSRAGGLCPRRKRRCRYHESGQRVVRPL